MANAAPKRPVGPGDHVFLVDGSSFVFRAFFQSINQDAKYNYRSDGVPTGAVRLFVTKLIQFEREGAVGIKPTHMAIILDKSEQTFRKEIYPDYKATRREPPDELVPQFPLMRAAIRALGMDPIEEAGFEADDLIATYACQARDAGAEVLIISSDKDMMQLVSDRVLVYDFESGAKGKPGYRPERKIDRAGVIDYFGVPPEKVTDVQALVGDTSDNVPGVPGIGVKTASQLIIEYGDLETLLARAGEIKQPRRRELLTTFADQARLSKRLVTLECNMKTVVPLSDLAVPDPDPRRLLAFLKAMEFSTLTKRIADLNRIDPETIESDPALKPTKRPAPGEGAAPPPADAVPAKAPETAFPESALPSRPVLRPYFNAPTSANGAGAAGNEPAAQAAVSAAAAVAVPINIKGYETVTSRARLEAWIAEASELGRVAVDVEATSFDPMQGEIVGISLATAPAKAAYIPLGHRNGETDLLGGGVLPGQVPMTEALDLLKPLLEDKSILKIGQNLKFDTQLFARHDIALDPYDDTMLLAYALDAGKGGTGMDELSEKWLAYTPVTFKEVAGSGRAQLTFDRVALDRATEYAAEDADVTLRLWMTLKPRLPAERMTNLYETLERPMVPVLARMEARGIKVDRQILSRLSGEFSQKLGGLEAEINELAGEPFNIGSPKQLGDILFGKLGLPGGKKTKTGAWSTGADVLEELAAAGNQLSARILDWRQLAKLKSTYTDLLPDYIHPETGRVHTSYALGATTTGRLSSSDPN
ncbi:MAG: DNA polymerase, partial [Bauldia sp.]